MQEGQQRTVGWNAHEAGVRRLQESYAAIPEGRPVRLAKPTSNLFRARGTTGTPGLDVSGLRGVVAVDVVDRTADVQGMCTYEDLVAATLPHGLIPLVVPQLRTITLGGAVTGLGIESTSFRNGLPHESVLEMEVFTGAGEVLTVKPGDALVDAFANSYGSLGYATRLKIELEPVPEYVELRHLRFTGPAALGEFAAVVEAVAESRTYDGGRVDGLDGVAFAPDLVVLTLARWSDGDGGPEAPTAGRTSDYTGQSIYYRSLLERDTDLLTVHDYLWRWDTDWFWCSGAFGLHDPRVRRLWPRRWRRSDVYHRLVGLDQRFGITARLDRRHGVTRERVIQDVEVPVARIGEFVSWFDVHVGMRPVWLCPLRLREQEAPDGTRTAARAWPTYPLEPGTTYVNAGFWGTVVLPPAPTGDATGDATGHRDGDLNRAIERRVTELGGHKSLYSDAYYDRVTFDRLYGTATLSAVKREVDPDDRLTGLYEKAVQRR